MLGRLLPILWEVRYPELLSGVSIPLRLTPSLHRYRKHNAGSHLYLLPTLRERSIPLRLKATRGLRFTYEQLNNVVLT